MIEDVEYALTTNVTKYSNGLMGVTIPFKWEPEQDDVYMVHLSDPIIERPHLRCFMKYSRSGNSRILNIPKE